MLMENSKTNIKMQLCNFVTSVKKAAFILGTATLVFAALRNSLKWHMQHFWGASHEFWQDKWIKVLDLTGGNEFLIYVIGGALVSFIPFWLFNLPLLVLDYTKKPSFLYVYKIQEDKDKKVTWKVIKHTIFAVLRNQFLGIFGIWAFLPLMRWRGNLSCGPELPYFTTALLELTLFVLVEEVLFYYSHRLLHHPKIYKYVHKIHHEWTAPISICSIYCHPVEYFFSNLYPLLVGPLLFGSHVTTSYLWIALATMNTINAHSGYHFPMFPSNEAHDFHHLKFNEMFGVLGILDRLHNTDAKFRVSKNYERHCHFFSFTPIKQLIPDPPACNKKYSKNLAKQE